MVTMSDGFKTTGRNSKCSSNIKVSDMEDADGTTDLYAMLLKFHRKI